MLIMDVLGAMDDLKEGHGHISICSLRNGVIQQCRALTHTFSRFFVFRFYFTIEKYLPR